MSSSAEQGKKSLLDRIGTGRNLDAYVVGVVFLEEGLLAVTGRAGIATGTWSSQNS